MPDRLLGRVSFSVHYFRKTVFEHLRCYADVRFLHPTTVVGYNTIAPNPDATESPCFGLCFAPVSGEKQKLGSFVPADGTSECGTDLIQVLNPTTQDPDYIMSYCDATMAAGYKAAYGGDVSDYIGWWYDGYEPGEEGGRADDYEVGLGDGFMGSFVSGYELQITSSGEVQSDATSFVINPDATESPVFANYLPRRIPLKYMTPVDGTSECGTDLIQVLNPTTQDPDYIMSYCDATMAAGYKAAYGGELEDYIGWWYDGYEPGEEGGRADGYPVEPGAGFMGSFVSGYEVELQMPSAFITIDDSEFVDPE